MKIPYLSPSSKLSRPQILIMSIAALALLLTFFNFSISYAASPINENIIKYRFFVKTLSTMSELKEDCVLPFELECTYHALKSEVLKASKDYNSTLNYIVNNFHIQPQRYEEFLKMLREKLAAEGIFPAQFNELRLDSNGVDETTAVQFLELRTKMFESRDPEPGNSAADAYQRAINHMKAGYDYYCKDDYDKSCNAFGFAVEHWQAYYKLLNWDAVDAGFAIARLRALQGCACVDGEIYETAKIWFNEAIKIYEQINETAGVIDIKILKAEIFYRQNLIGEFIKAMKEIQYKGNPAYNAHGEIGCRRDLIYSEYRRLSSPTFSIMTKGAQKNRENYIKGIEYLKNDSHLNKEYINKFIKRYEKILEYNSFDIVKLSFEATDKYIRLKDHMTKTVIGFPQWEKKLVTQYDYTTIENQPVALITGNKLEFFVGIYSLTGTDPTWDLIGRTIINGKEVKFKNRGIVSRAENVFIHKFESDEDFTDKKVKVVLLEIEWWLRTFDKNRAKEFSLGKTSHKVYVVRTYTTYPCYWQIVEYTCNWMKDLSASQLTADRNVVEAIWEGCSFKNLEELDYRYQFPNKDGRLLDLLVNKYGKCGQWASFLQHCFYCQGVKNVNTFGTGGERVGFWSIKNYKEGLNNQTCQFKFPFIGQKAGEPSPFFPEHALVGYGGKVVTSSYGLPTYEGGELFDIVFHKKITNSSPQIYEDSMISLIEDNPGKDTHENILSVQEYMLICSDTGSINPAPEKKDNKVVENE